MTLRLKGLSRVSYLILCFFMISISSNSDLLSVKLPHTPPLTGISFSSPLTAHGDTLDMRKKIGFSFSVVIFGTEPLRMTPSVTSSPGPGAHIIPLDTLLISAPLLLTKASGFLQPRLQNPYTQLEDDYLNNCTQSLTG